MMARPEPEIGARNVTQNRITGGIWPAVLTAVDEAGTPDLDAMDRLVELFVEQEMGGLYLLGSTGQGPSLSMETRKAVCERVCRTNDGRLPVLAHIGATSTYDAMELARHAESCGADAISAVPPIYYPVDATLTFRHYDLIGGATKLPFIPYHTGFNNIARPPAREYAELMRNLPNFAGIKLTDSNFTFFALMRLYLGDEYVLFSGFDEITAHAVMSGSNGAIGSWMNLIGPEVRKMDAALRGGDVACAMRFTRVMCEIVGEIVDVRSNFFPFLHQGMKYRYGIDVGPGRGAMHISTVVYTDDEVRPILDRIVEAVA
ncbi:MAG: hypothetical protein CMJ18_00885 [Phycisphaeraceae bacterium]|nr:hypothetical protein [Phycisphaeraceae bacterium]